MIPATKAALPSTSSSLAALAGSIVSKDLLHKRLGHLHDAGISKLASMDLSGIPPTVSFAPI